MCIGNVFCVMGSLNWIVFFVYSFVFVFTFVQIFDFTLSC